MPNLLGYYLKIGVLTSFTYVVICLAYNIDRAAATSRLRTLGRNISFPNIRVPSNQTLDAQNLHNQSFGLEELCMPATCGAECATQIGNNASSSASSSTRTKSGENIALKRHPLRRYLVDEPDDPSGYVTALSKIITIDGRWLSLNHSDGAVVTTLSFTYESSKARYGSASGVKGLWGCTSVVIASDVGVFLSHLWEGPAFRTTHAMPRAFGYSSTYTFNLLRGGQTNALGEESVGFGTLLRHGEILSSRRRPVAFIITPFTTKEEEDQGVERVLRYGTEVDMLAKDLKNTILSSEPVRVIGYTRTTRSAAQNDDVAVGKVIVEVDQNSVVERRRGKTSNRIQGSWRLWVDDGMEYEQHFDRPLPKKQPVKSE